MIENTLINKSQNKRSKFIKKYVYTLQYTKIDNDDNSCLYIYILPHFYKQKSGISLPNFN
jgi:hypothetical protein